MRRAFEVKRKTFFQVSQVLSFRLAKQTTKNVWDTTFNITAELSQLLSLSLIL